MKAKDSPTNTGAMDLGWFPDISERPALSLHVIPDTTASFATVLDVSRGRVWTTPVVGWDIEARKAVVLDPGTAELELLEVMDEDRGRAACIWSSSTLFGGKPMSAQRAEDMLRGHDDDGGQPPLRVV